MKLKLEIDLIPKTAWCSNLRTKIPQGEWNKLKKQCYADAGNRCAICGAEGRLNCHEIWGYDDDKYIQKLNGFIALCNDCHLIKHIGRARVLASEGLLDMDELIKHFMNVNGVDRGTFDEHLKESLEVWRKRSQHKWKTDLGEWASLITD